MIFKVLDYQFSPKDYTAIFRYQGKSGVIFCEKIEFDHQKIVEYNHEALDRALFFAAVVLGTSYYKAEPTPDIVLPRKINRDEATFFNQIYQEGMSQFAYENHLTRADLAHFEPSPLANTSLQTYTDSETLVLLSGGKDSLLVAEKFSENHSKMRTLYIANSDAYPAIINSFGPPLLIRRHLDRTNLKKAGGKNGHVPVTLINEALALVQAILSGFSSVQLGLGREGIEPHAQIGNLVVNHQWSKTPDAQSRLREYIAENITESIEVGSILSTLSELDIAKQFAELCWAKFGDKFSSCNVANYKQNTDNYYLKWCGRCAKCANSYLLFAPFIAFPEQKKLFGRDLFTDPDLTEDFKGLLGVEDVMKPFECVASTSELRWAYHHRLPGYGELLFFVPKD